MASVLRCLSDISCEKTDDERNKTITSKDQVNRTVLNRHAKNSFYLLKSFIFQILTEHLIEKCYQRFEHLKCLDPSLPLLLRKEHIKFLEASLLRLSQSYECLDSSRPWLVYWILNAGELMNHKFSESTLDNVIEFLIK